jgi:stage II sporulation protein GA (sporulation sigma-E factor processing peptidase)
MESVKREVRNGGVDTELYIDVIFFVNFFMDSLLLYFLRGFLRKPASLRRIICGGAAGGLFGCMEIWLLKLPGWVTAAASLGAAAGMMKIVYRPGDLRELVKETGSFWLLAILAGGIMEFFYDCTRAGFYLETAVRGKREHVLPLLTWLFLAAGTCLLAAGLGQFAREMRRERRNRYLVVLADGDEVVETTGYLDTGNLLREPGTGGGVQIVAERIWYMFAGAEKKKVRIPYHTVGNPHGEMEGIQIESMKICRAGGRITVREPWIARAPYKLTGDGSYEVLLHGETVMALWDKKGGITSGD